MPSVLDARMTSPSWPTCCTTSTPAATIVPYIGAGAGIAFVDSQRSTARDSTQFAYQAIVGVGYNIDPMFRVNLDGRYYGTTNPTVTSAGSVHRA